jgi:hypothetical protein
MRAKQIGTAAVVGALAILAFLQTRADRAVSPLVKVDASGRETRAAPAPAPPDAQIVAPPIAAPPAGSALAGAGVDPDGLPACPSREPSNQSPCEAVEHAVRTCGYMRGEQERVCACRVSEAGSALWECRSPAAGEPDVSCPMSAPATGTTCPVKDQACFYDGAGPDSTFCACGASEPLRWKCQPYREVYPPPK